MDETLLNGIHWVTRGLEVVGIAIIVMGAVTALLSFLRKSMRRGPQEETIGEFRSSLGRSILLGLEFLVAADIVSTVAIDPTLESLAVLAGIILIRTFLSFSLEVEIEGHWPWQASARRQSAGSAPGSDGADQAAK